MGLLRLPWMKHPPEAYTGGAVTVGNFDGVHLGHLQLLRTARSEAHSLAGSWPTVAVTFDPPPTHLLYPETKKVPLTTIEQRADLLHEAGADHVVVLQADAGLVSLSPVAFFEDVLLSLFRTRVLVEGYNFRFGRNRAGDGAMLQSLCDEHQIKFVEVPQQQIDGEVVSSSQIRKLLGKGAVDQAAVLLGRDYSIRGVVVAGAQRGRTIGFPTANLDEVKTLLPAEGVYAGWATVQGKRYAAAANLGPNPTFAEQALKLEIHLINYQGDLYGQPLTFEFRKQLRTTRRFANVQDLQSQLKQDVESASQLLRAVVQT